jgi:beta-lactamase regulating signal transducer with metallopeptidase domain
VNAELPLLLIQCVGWTLLHFVWQGLLVAALLASGLRVLRNAAPNQRYLAGCFALLLLTAAPAVTFNRVWRQNQLPDVTGQVANPALASANYTGNRDGAPDKIIIKAKPKAHQLDFAERVERFLPLIVAGWLAGVLVLSFKLFVGWMQIKRLTRIATVELEEVWHRKLIELGRRLGMNRPVRLFNSALVEVPTVIGWLRPVILLPASCLVGLSPAQLESILAHELAHIRRHDYLVNLLQSVVETFLFYHPAVWWVSRRVREERELCCDDLAVEICGDRIAYARALATLEELRVAPAQLALAAGGAPLLQRIRRLAGQSRRSAQRPTWPVLGIMFLVIVFGLMMLLRGNRAEAGNGGSEPTNVPTLQPQIQHPNSIYRRDTIHTGLGRQVIHDKLERIEVESVYYKGLPLDEVLKNLSEISRSRDPDHQGINFYFDRLGFPTPDESTFPENLPAGLVEATSVKVNIDPALHHLRLVDVLDAIVDSADRPISYSILDYAVVFRVGGPLETRVFHVDPNTFRQGLESVGGIPLGNTSNGSGNSGGTGGGQPVTALVPQVKVSSGATSGSIAAPNESRVRQFLAAAGMDMDTNNPANAGKMFVWKDKKGILLVRTTAKELASIEAGLSALNAPKPEVNLKVKLFEIEKQGFVDANAAPLKLTGILAPEQFRFMVENLERRNGTDELNFAEVTTESDREVQMQFDAHSSTTNHGIATPPAGPVLNLIPSVSADKNSVVMTVIHVAIKSGALETNSASIPDGQTIVLQRPEWFASTNTNRMQMIFITPTLINADGTRFHNPTADSTLTNSNSSSETK